jgi:hypothetical protein
MSGYSRSPKLLKGALVQFSAPMIIPIPNIILFQYNPESLSRTLSAYAPADSAAAGPDQAVKDTNARSQPFDPKETFNLTLQLDASDALEAPETHPVAVLTGVADRLAALEMLLYPSADSGGFQLSISVSASIGGGGGGAGAAASADLSAAATPVPAKKAPTTLFVWGPGRIVPVRVTTFSVEEQLNNPMLYPLRAKVTLGLKVLTINDFPAEDKRDVTEKIAVACYQFTMKQKQVLALANLANGVESILGMLPF